MEIQNRIDKTYLISPKKNSTKNNNGSQENVSNNSINSYNYGKVYATPYFRDNDTSNIVNSSYNEKMKLYQNNIPEFIAKIEALKDKSGEDFINSAYPLVVKLMNLEDVAPDNIIWEKNEGRPIAADYFFYNNNLVVYSDYMLKMNKVDQVKILAHELTHCKQTTNILRTEGLGPKEYALAIAESDLRANTTKNSKIQAAIVQAKQNGTLQQLMTKLIIAQAQKTYKELLQYHKKTLELPKILKDSPEGRQAYKDIAAQHAANSADIKTYLKDPLELEAKGTEKMIENILS